MALFGWFSKIKKNKNVKVTEHKTSMLQDAATAAAFAEAGEHDTARSIMDKPAKQPRKILIIGREENFSTILSDYAVDMAQRLGFELVALNISSAPLSMPAAGREAAIAAFREGAARNAAALAAKAANSNITFSHLVEIGTQDEIVEKLHAADHGLRYVLTEPDPEVVKTTANRATIPVFDLGCSQPGSAA